MNDKITISTFQLFKMFPDAETARTYLESRRWPQGPRCPVCGLLDRITVRKEGYYRCNQCKEDFTVRTGTVFERSHVPLHKWLYAMYLLVTARKGISSLQLSKQIGITQKSAWFVLQRLREACGSDLKTLSGIVEVDECYVGGVAESQSRPLLPDVCSKGLTHEKTSQTPRARCRCRPRASAQTEAEIKARAQAGTSREETAPTS